MFLAAFILLFVLALEIYFWEQRKRRHESETLWADLERRRQQRREREGGAAEFDLEDPLPSVYGVEDILKAPRA